MKVYRVEHKKSCGGPYRNGGEFCNKLGRAHGWNEPRDLHPTLGEELGWSKIYKVFKGGVGFHCGFSSPTELKSWFKGWLRGLQKNGFVVRVYEASKFLEGKKQTLFLRRKKNLLGEFSVLARKFEC